MTPPTSRRWRSCAQRRAGAEVEEQYRCTSAAFEVTLSGLEENGYSRTFRMAKGSEPCPRRGCRRAARQAVRVETGPERGARPRLLVDSRPEPMASFRYVVRRPLQGVGYRYFVMR